MQVIHTPSYPAPMNEVEPGVMLIQEPFLKELAERIKNQNFDLSIRQLGDGVSHVVELTVRHAVEPNQVSTLCHSIASDKAKDYYESLKQTITDTINELNKSI